MKDLGLNILLPYALYRPVFFYYNWEEISAVGNLRKRTQASTKLNDKEPLVR